MGSPSYIQQTGDISVNVLPVYLEQQSDPDTGKFIWAYRVLISNQGQEPVTLRVRHWDITDALGRKQEVHGEGVVGEQPLLKPGESFTYTSGTPLDTPSGFMVGYYEMERGNGERFTVDIPAFSLDIPNMPRMVH